MKIPKVSLIILNWNNWKDTIECLESLYQINIDKHDIIILDCGSKDGSIKKIKEYCSGELEVFSPYLKYKSDNKPISLFVYDEQKSDHLSVVDKYLSCNKKKLFLISLKKNYGFTGGNNIGMSFAETYFKPDYLFLLNNDTVMIDNIIDEMLHLCEKNNKIGLCGPEIRLYGNPKEIQFKLRYQGINSPTEVPWISGCAFLIKSELIKKIGFLDPIFFIYYEETDYILRAKKANYKIYYIPTKSKLYHKFAATNKKIKGFTQYHMTKSYIIFIKKHSSSKDFHFKLSQFIRKEIKKNLGRINLYFVIKGILIGYFLSLFRSSILN